MKLSLIICTYNRCNLLKGCIESILFQLKEETELIIIDNNSKDLTEKITKQFCRKNTNIKYFEETKKGLSHARNRGVVEAKSDWVLFLDDDVIVFEDFVERAIWLVNQNYYDCVGGNYLGYAKKRPKWLPSSFESYNGQITELSKCNYNDPIGCNVLFRKEAIINVGLFDPNYGMKGKKIGYGDETDLQFRMEQIGYKIGFDPYLKVNHLIRDEKMKLRWHLTSSFARGKASIFQKKGWTLSYILFKNLLSFSSLVFKRLPQNLSKVIFKKDYYWQNLIVDSLHGNLYYFGLLVSYRKNVKTYPASYKDRTIRLS